VGAGLLCSFRWELGPHLTQCAWAEAYLRTKWHLGPSSHLATTDMGRKLGLCPLFLGGGELGPQHADLGLVNVTCLAFTVKVLLPNKFIKIHVALPNITQQHYSCSVLPSAIIADRSKIFLIKYDSCNNLLFKRSQLSL